MLAYSASSVSFRLFPSPSARVLRCACVSTFGLASDSADVYPFPGLCLALATDWVQTPALLDQTAVEPLERQHELASAGQCEDARIPHGQAARGMMSEIGWLGRWSLLTVKCHGVRRRDRRDRLLLLIFESGRWCRTLSLEPVAEPTRTRFAKIDRQFVPGRQLAPIKPRSDGLDRTEGIRAIPCGVHSQKAVFPAGL
jgi:hypothetical protein